MMDVDKTRSLRAYELGHAAGTSAGTWVIDGNTSRETCATIVRMDAEGDPALYDLVNEPAPLSGEWAGEPTPADVYASLDMGADDVQDADPAGQLLTDYELGFSAGFWCEVCRACRAQLDDA